MSFPLMPLVSSQASQPGVLWEPVGGLGATIDMHQLSVSDNGVWVAARANAAGVVSRSTDYGLTWTDRTSGLSDPAGTMGSAFGEGFFVFTEWSGTGIGYWNPTNGSTGVLISGTRDNFRANYNDGYFVVGSGTAGGSGAIYASANGSTWFFAPQTTTFGANSATCGIYVASLNRTFAGGNQYRYVNNVPTASAAWTGSSTGLSGRITDVAWSPTANIAVATGPSGIYSSENLITWTLRQSASNMYGVSWCENQFVAVGSAGKIYTSEFGGFWTLRTSGTTADLYGAAGYNGVILVVGFDGTVLRSS